MLQQRHWSTKWLASTSHPSATAGASPASREEEETSRWMVPRLPQGPVKAVFFRCFSVVFWIFVCVCGSGTSEVKAVFSVLCVCGVCVCVVPLTWVYVCRVHHRVSQRISSFTGRGSRKLLLRCGLMEGLFVANSGLAVSEGSGEARTASQDATPFATVRNL
jgi:hypothetical protein